MSNDGMKEEVEVRILTLSDCDYCSWLKSELDSCGINYTNIDAELFSDFADEIEEKFKTEFYPIVFIESGPKIITIVSETDLDTSETLRTFDTIPHLVGMIKSYIK
jgi:glutaredoxin